MPNKITEAEEHFNALLPKQRLVHGAPAELIAAGKAWSEVIWAEAEWLGPMALSDVEIVQGSRLTQSPVFICGVHRSGTTLVRDLLDYHPELVVLPSEGTYYTNLEAKLNTLPDKERAAFIGKEWLRRLANPINQAPYWLLGRSTDAASPYVNFARYLMAWWDRVEPQMVVVLAYASVTHKLGAKLWVDKTPTNERFLDRIWRDMPNAKIIHVVREPLATLASRKKMEPTIPLRRALADLKTSFKIAIEQQSLKDERFMLVRYEELCDDPEGFKMQIATFLSIDASDVLKQPTVAGVPAKANSSFGSESIAGQVAKPAGDREVVLSEEEMLYIAANVGDAAHKLDYHLPLVNLIVKAILRSKHWLLNFKRG